MSSERKPLLSDADVSKMSVTENGFAGENKYRMGRRIRDFYEDLITTGKLRVVQDVELDDSIRGFLMCPSCKRDMRSDEWSGWEFCPCGNKIRR